MPWRETRLLELFVASALAAGGVGWGGWYGWRRGVGVRVHWSFFNDTSDLCIISHADAADSIVSDSCNLSCTSRTMSIEGERKGDREREVGRERDTHI